MVPTAVRGGGGSGPEYWKWREEQNDRLRAERRRAESPDFYDSDEDMEMEPEPVPVPDFLTPLPPELLAKVLSFTDGLPCEEIAKLCRTSRAFNELCQRDDFWKWQCALRDYDRDDRLGPGGGPKGGTWRAHYQWWCEHAFLDRDALRAAGFQLSGDNYVHPEYGPISTWDVSRVESMVALFEDATSFNGDLSRWNVSRVRNMERMFRNATSFNADISEWDVSGVLNMRRMFQDATSFNQDLSRWNVDRRIVSGYFYEMFMGATSMPRRALSRFASRGPRETARRASHNAFLRGYVARWRATRAARGSVDSVQAGE